MGETADMQLFLDSLGIELKLLFWVVLGSICGLAVELGTGDNKSSILYQAKLFKGSLFIQIVILVINVLVGTIFAYVGTPLIAVYTKFFNAQNMHILGYFVGMASLSLVRAFAATWKNKGNITDFIFKLIDFLRSMK